MRIWLALVVALAIMVVASGGAAAAPTQVDGCTTITQSGEYRLAGDVVPDGTVDGACLTVEADDVTLDGAGHAVTDTDGAGTGLAVGGASNVTIRDINVTGWWVGVAVAPGSSGLVVRESTVADNEMTGLQIETGYVDDPLVLAESEIAGNYNGVKAASAPGTVIRDNDFRSNQRTGVVVTSSSGTRIVENLISGSDPGTDPARLDGYGVFVSLSGGVAIEDNEIVRNANGVTPSFLAHTELEDNAIAENERGIFVFGFWSGFSAHCNTIEDNQDYGVLSNVDTWSNATNNYWGAANGPGGGHADPLSGAVADGDGDAVSGAVTWDPYLSEPCGVSANEPPSAVITVDPDPPRATEPVTLDAGSSSDPDGEIVEYGWVVDGEDVGSEEVVEHLLGQPYDEHTVELTVVDDDGANDTSMRDVVVAPPGEAGGDGLVAVCHVQTEPNQTVFVAPDALPRHNAHGDSPGACDDGKRSKTGEGAGQSGSAEEDGATTDTRRDGSAAGGREGRGTDGGR